MKELKEGEIYEFCFLDVDIVEHSKILILNPPHLVEKSLDEFEKYVAESVNKYGGSIWGWQGDGGLCTFYGEQKAINSTLCALDVLNGLRVFNLDKERKPISDEIKIRIGIHKGTAKYRKQHGRIHSVAINFVAHLQKSFAEPNTIVISESVYNELFAEQKEKFTKVGDFQGQEIYGYGFLEKEEEMRYFFSWGDVPGKHTERLLEDLGKNLKIEWVKSAKIEKSDDNKTITLGDGKNLITLKLNEGKNMVTLKIGDWRAHEYILKEENGKLNIYKRSKTKLHTGKKWIKYWRKEEEDTALNNIVGSIIKSGWYPDYIVAIFDPDAPGGVVVGGKLTFLLGDRAKITPRLSTIRVEGREPSDDRIAIATDLPTLSSNEKNILVVDDVTFTGRTLETAYGEIKRKYPNVEVKFATLAVGKEMEERMKTNRTPIRMEFPYKVIFGSRTIFSWDIVGPTGTIRDAFDIQYPDGLSFIPDYMVRPWGYMEIFALEKKAFVRILTILPGRRLSYQKHEFRDEYFVALDDGLVIKIENNEPVCVQKGDYIMIPRGTLHRFSNPTENPVRSLEVTFGKYDQNDIERPEDDYGRPEKGDEY